MSTTTQVKEQNDPQAAAMVAECQDRLADTAKQFHAWRDRIRQDIIGLGELLEQAHEDCKYGRDGGWAAYCKEDLQVSEWTANRFRHAFMLGSPDHCNLPHLSSMVETTAEANDFVYKAANNGSAKIAKGIDRAIGQGKTTYKKVQLPTVPMNSKQAKELFKALSPKEEKTNGKKGKEAAQDKSKNMDSSEGSKPDIPLHGDDAKAIWSIDKDEVKAIKRWIEEADTDHEDTVTVLEHLRMCWQLIDSITEGDAKHVKSLLKSV